MEYGSERAHSPPHSRTRHDSPRRALSPASTQARMRYGGLNFATSHLGTSSLRHRRSSLMGSAYGSPGPSHSWRVGGFPDHGRRSVARTSHSGHENRTVSHEFSLAGPPPMDAIAANQPYIDPGYSQLNPAYDQPSNVRPVWSLAKPLPRVLRPGMVPTKDELQKEIEEEQQDQEQHNEAADLESGKIEPSLRPDKITSTLDVVRRERELSLYRAYQHRLGDSPTFSPLGGPRRGSDAPTETPDTRLRIDDTIPEEGEGSPYYREEPPHLELPPLREAAEESIDEFKEGEEEDADIAVPYEDAVPLPAYDAEDDEIHNLHTYWSVLRLKFREPLAEFLAVLTLDTLGFSANLSLTVFGNVVGTADTTAWSWGFATMIAIYVAGGVSGAHLNPFMSFMLYVYRGFPLAKIPIFLPAQFLGAFCAALITHEIFLPGLLHLVVEQQGLTFQGRNTVLASESELLLKKLTLPNYIGFPRRPWVDFRTAFLTEMTGATLLSLSVLALGDDRNAPPGAGMNAFIVGLLVVVLSMGLGYQTGLTLNPVRDFAPRCAMSLLGYGKDQSLFEDGYWFYVAWLGPITGVLLGGLLYDGAIFTGGESPVNYPTKRMKRAVRKWRKRLKARFRRTKRAVAKNGVMGNRYETLQRS